MKSAFEMGNVVEREAGHFAADVDEGLFCMLLDPLVLAVPGLVLLLLLLLLRGTRLVRNRVIIGIFLTLGGRVVDEGAQNLAGLPALCHGRGIVLEDLAEVDDANSVGAAVWRTLERCELDIRTGGGGSSEKQCRRSC